MWNPFKKKQMESCNSLVDSNSKDLSNHSLITMTSNEESAKMAYPISDNNSLQANQIFDSPMSSNAQMKVAEMSIGLAHQAMDVYKTSLMVEQNIAAIRASSEIQLAQIVSKYEFCKSALDHIFQDRHSALTAHYCILNDAMKSNDRDMIIEALRGISSIVVTSPLSDFNEIINNWDSFSKKKPLELDF